MIVLHDYWRSSAAYRVRIALNLVGLAYESHAVNLLTGDHRSPANRARNPQGLVPTLEIDGMVLTQSLAIIEYLGETRGPPMVPAEAAGRARVRALAHAIAMEIAPVCNLSTRNRAAAISGGTVTPDDWVRPVIEAGLAAFEVMLDHPATGRFCHGDTITLADLCLVPQVYNARRVGLDFVALPRITRIMAALEALPQVAAAHPDRHAPAGVSP